MVNLVYQCEIRSETGTHISDFPIHYSVTSAQHYAGKYDCDYIFNTSMTLEGAEPYVLRDDEKWDKVYADRYFNILDLIYDPVYEKYDNILYLDTDVIVDPYAKNIFEVNGIDENTDIIGTPEPNEHNSTGPHSRMYEKFGSHLVGSTRKDIRYRIINTGVIVFTKNGRKKAKETWDVDWRDWRDNSQNWLFGNDQPYINAMMIKHNFNVIELSDSWNRIMGARIMGNLDNKKSHFYHFSGYTKGLMANFKKSRIAGL
jgi:lipopolysaccharide biosynthesis glycosyltransferase